MLQTLFSLLFSFLVPTTSASSDLAPVAEFDVNVHIKAQLAERNRQNESSVQVQTPVFNTEKPFSQYADLPVSGALLNRAETPENLLESGHFDPAKNNFLVQKITEPFLRDRGIQEVISVGVSDFTGSSKNRLANIEATLKKFDGQIIEQGADFSFNELLKEVTEADGFKYERVIVGGKDRWGLGGGVCQVSTNLFRAALNAGLPILERRNHSRAIEKYAPHGLDATIYLGQLDLRFTNDTPGDILMRFVMRENKLFTVFYGTKDTRSVTLEKSHHWEGYDGRLTTHWTRAVSKGSEEQAETFVSHYSAFPKAE